MPSVACETSMVEIFFQLPVRHVRSIRTALRATASISVIA